MKARTLMIKACAAAVLLGAINPPAYAGAFLFTGNAGLEDRITHPVGYTGAGGVLANNVCLDTSVLPSGVSAATVEATLLKSIRSWNRNRGVTRNLNFASNNDIPNFGDFDFESGLVHELGHCTSLAHPNLASESGLPSPTNNATQAQLGPNGVFDTNAGSDGNPGSADDIRGDDINRYWFVPGSNDPLDLPATVDISTVSRDIGDLPSSAWPANGDRTVLAALGYPNTESVMQQQQTNAEVQRRPTNEDIRQLRLGMAGVDRTANTGDDYTIELVYLGQGVSGACDITVEFDPGTSFAACAAGGAFLGSNIVMTSAAVRMSPTINWYFSPIENTTTTITGTSPASPGPGDSVTIDIAVSRDSSNMTGTPSGDFEIALGGQTCTGSLSGGTGACSVTASGSGSQTITASYFGFEGFDASEGTGSVNISAPTPTVTVTSSPNPSLVGQSYTVSVDVSSGSGTPTGTIDISDGSTSCTTPALAGGSASCALSANTAGNRTLTASYSGDSKFNSAQGTANHTVNPATPTVTITSDDPDPSALGQNYTVAVAVNGAGATPSGTVNVSDGSASCTVTLSGGSGSCALSSSSAGLQTLTATYGGDANYTSANDTEPHTVTPQTPVVTIVSDTPDPSTVGQAYTVAVSVTGTLGIPTGTVTVSDGSQSCTTGALVAGAASCLLTSTTAGAKTLTATYSGDSNFNTASGTDSHLVNPGNPTVAITSDTPDPSALGGSYTVIVEVSGAGVTPSGDVDISDGTDSCTASLNNGSGSCDITSSTAGSKTLTVSYPGDANYNSGSATEDHTVAQGTPTVTITSDLPDPSALGEDYTVAVTVSGDGVSPTGAVSVSDIDGSCQITLSNGSGSCALTGLSAGERTVTASFAGDSNYLVGSDTESHTVNSATADVIVNSATPSPSDLSQPYSVDITVTGDGAAPTGTVTISDGTDDCQLTLSSGSGSCSITSTTAGEKTLTASYVGDSNYAASSGTLTHTVNRVTPDVAIIEVDPSPSIFGEAFTVTVSVGSTAGTPTGTLVIGDGEVQCTTAPISGGSASCALTPSSAGVKTLTASYAGDSNFMTAQTTDTHTVEPAVTTLTITGSAPNPSQIDQPYEVSVEVTSAAGNLSGTVEIDNGEVNCTTSELINGVASCVLSSSTAGEKTLNADYAGNSNFASAQDSAVHTVSTKPPEDDVFEDRFEANEPD